MLRTFSYWHLQSALISSQKRWTCRAAAWLGGISLLVSAHAVDAFAKAAETESPFRELRPNVFLFPDTCNVYVIRCGDKAVAIDCGSAKMLSHLSDIGVKHIDWVLFTHHHRDQCQGIFRILEHGAKIAVPEGETEFFDGVEEFWREADIYRRYRFKTDFFVLPQSVPGIDRVLKDGDVMEIDDLQIRAVRTPGAYPGPYELRRRRLRQETRFHRRPHPLPGKAVKFPLPAISVQRLREARGRGNPRFSRLAGFGESRPLATLPRRAYRRPLVSH